MASGKEAARRKKREAKRKLTAPPPKSTKHSLHRGTSAPANIIPDAIIDDILAKRDLLVHPDLARTVAARYLGKNPGLVPKLRDVGFLRSAKYEPMKKWVRQELRVLVGMFVIETKPERLLDSDPTTILDAHRSTKERLPFYPELYRDLFAGEMPKHILDLCAGINPCSYEFLGCTPQYTAIDVSPQLMDFVQAWFTKSGIDGTAYAADITHLPDSAIAEDVDMVFLFKATDVLERVKYGYAEQLLTRLFAGVGPSGRRVIVSFATATISGTRGIAVQKRTWVERWAEAHNRKVRVHDITGERFYVLE